MTVDCGTVGPKGVWVTHFSVPHCSGRLLPVASYGPLGGQR